MMSSVEVWALEPYHITRVGTARKGTHLNIKGRLKHPLTFIVGTRGQTLKIRPVVIELSLIHI